VSSGWSLLGEKRPLRLLLGVVVIAALVTTVAVLSGGAPSVATNAPAGFKCAPYTAFPSVRLGHHATVGEKFGGYHASFSATATKGDTLAYPNGMPFTGVLTVTHDGQSWTLPRPSYTKYYQIDYLCVVRFSPGESPSVLVEGFTGGAHCCEVPVLYSYNSSTSQYVKAVDMSPNNYKSSLAFDINGGFRPRLVGTKVLLQTEDDHFAYTFGCYACTPMPIVLDAFNGTKLTDVTAQHPSLLRREAASLFKSATMYAKGEHSPALSGIGPFGPLAAWTADECALDRGAQAWASVLRFQSAGELSDKIYFADTLIKGSFVAQLRTFLLKGDYCSGQFG
jgi:hypothetical protein